ncbi:hypothetical protein CEXT_479011, partial [Caerostris extrusa]
SFKKRFVEVPQLQGHYYPKASKLRLESQPDKRYSQEIGKTTIIRRLKFNFHSTNFRTRQKTKDLKEWGETLTASSYCGNLIVPKLLPTLLQTS